VTYCVGIRLDSGLVFASDSRTNAGVDHIATFRKMNIFEQPGERLIVLLSSGNLAMTQSVVSLLREHARREGEHEQIMNTQSMFSTAELVGQALREVHHRDGPHLLQRNIDATASFILGGQIRGEEQRLFTIYNEGNFIEATPETPYFQIGEIKYGKPIIDRVVTSQTSVMEAAKCVLISFDSTMRSNISVGLPIDLLTYAKDTLHVGMHRRIREHDPYFDMIHRQWGEGLKKVFAQLPPPHWND
jgi:putative proteasome-type protease